MDKLVIEKDDVAELVWLYNNSFWPDTFGNKNDLIEFIKEELEIIGMTKGCNYLWNLTHLTSKTFLANLFFEKMDLQLMYLDELR